ncbi:uncharacterized protein B0I36DRAFT_319839 [Microdochium trichocladiopsis]|uniref:Uncharacterized protein n=1 Tax=Microdochium trichocladiopsis TaxID=1682393 RepID=A0A9P8YAS1_9PEZI|nr:uncharacterized protein B0I36DRAFT_319839 [Microdochium trichocladiopsis]KAH7032678.1 hypothetical protein B0I36DRAFT_319839 [Microdochium trichocladiopsis]
MMAYHALLDHVFRSLAWWIVRVTDVRSFSNHYIAVLARWSVKLKTIALDPTRWAENSLARAEDVLRQINTMQKSEDVIVIEFPGDEKKPVVFPNDTDWDIGYYQGKSLFRDQLHTLVSAVLSSLDVRFLLLGDQLRTLLCRSGLDQELRQFTINGSGAIQTSTNIKDMLRSYTALKLLLAISRKIGQVEDIPASHSDNSVKVVWNCQSDNSQPKPDTGTVETTRLDHVVSLLLPMAIAGQSARVTSLDTLLSVFVRAANEPPQPALQVSVENFPRLEVNLSMRWNHAARSRDAKREAGVLPPFKAPLMVSEDDTEVDIGNDSPEYLLRQGVAQVLQDYASRKAEILSWTVTQDTVSVSTKRYSSTALVIAIGAILGSIPLPFVVKDSLPGVDPFQLVMFSWLLVGAFLVVAKSRYVENWPWHDFLRMQVVCRSVSELAKAARVDRQAVLLHLLHHEYRHPLVFSGPYPGMFRRQKDSGGFNVDVPTQHATIVAAGFIVFEGFESQLDSDKLEKRTVIQDTREGRDGERLAFQVDEMSRTVAGKRRLKRIKGQNEEEEQRIIRRFEVLGLSTKDWNFT